MQRYHVPAYQKANETRPADATAGVGWLAGWQRWQRPPSLRAPPLCWRQTHQVDRLRPLECALQLGDVRVAAEVMENLYLPPNILPIVPRPTVPGRGEMLGRVQAPAMSTAQVSAEAPKRRGSTHAGRGGLHAVSSPEVPEDARESPKLAFGDRLAGVSLAGGALEAAARDPETAGAQHVPQRILLGDILRSASAGSTGLTEAT